ncbi:unnamed protein product [Haemonchus placei]|uniref:Endo/exonuclease/phosphatase domain-containing protein n=1 Tax=Haemonchus placei TaxID=6290 RepID=A0A0N4WA06_HAEPC|nr:unnamed protein product [Haemonchus placei]
MMEPPSFVVKSFHRETSAALVSSCTHQSSSRRFLRGPAPRFAIPRLRHKAISIVTTYSPRSTAEKVELDAFHDQLEKIIHNGKYFYNFIVGDFNARLGEAQEEEFRIGKFGMGDRNENGNSLAGLFIRRRCSEWRPIPI